MSKTKTLAHADWCLKAASRDEMRPVLTALNITLTELASTDGHRLHVAVRNIEDGLVAGTWTKTPGQQVIGVGKFPDFWQVFPPLTATRVLDAAGALPILDAAIAYAKARGAVAGEVTLPATEGGQSVRCSAQYIKDALTGRETDRVRYQAPSPTTPMTWFIVGLVRVAVVMPIRGANPGVADRRFDLAEFVHADEQLAEVRDTEVVAA